MPHRRAVHEEIPADPGERAALGRLVGLRQEQRRRIRTALYALCALCLLPAAALWTLADDLSAATLVLVLGVLYTALGARALRRSTARLERIAAALGGGLRIPP